MEQLKFDLGPTRNYRPLSGPRCPCCKQRLTTKRSLLTAWQNLRDWLVKNWDIAAQTLLQQQVRHPTEVKLQPDLQWAIEASAGYEGLELNDFMNQVVDGFLSGEFDRLIRRGKKLVLPDGEISESQPDLSSEHTLNISEV